MAATGRRGPGFTAIELMVTLAVVMLLAMIAMPSFEGLRQRVAIRGAGEQALGFWNQARLEAAKRSQMVIEPKRTSLADPYSAGTIRLAGPHGQFAYRLNLHVDRFGRATLCEPATATQHLPDFGSRKCAD